MDATRRNLLAGLAGLAILLVSILIYAQVNASHNFDLSAYPQQQQP